MAVASNYRLLEKEILQQIHEGTLEILANTGIVFRSPEVLDVFRHHGVRVDGQTVYISEAVLDRALESVPAAFDWEARNPEHSIRVGQGQRGVHVSLVNGPVYVQDPEGERRRGTLDDLINFYKLGQQSSTCGIVGQIPVEPADLDPKRRHLDIFYQLLRHTDKPLFGYVGTRSEIEHMFDMLAVVFGEDFIRDRNLIGVSLNPLSPLRYDEIPCETLLTYAKRRQPVMVLTCAMSGVSAPIQPLGTVVLQNAEILAGLVLTQMVSPGTAFIYSPGSAVPDMRTCNYITGLPMSAMINMAGIQLAKELYRLPTRCMAGLTDAKSVDCQAGYETMQNFLMLFMAGVDVINESYGTLDALMSVSYEKFIIDDELLERAMCLLEGFDTSTAALSLDAIGSVAHDGSYLSHPSTFQGFRNIWRPTVSEIGSYSGWEKNGRPSIVDRAGQRVRAILAECPESLLDPGTDKSLRGHLERVQGAG